MAIPAQPSRFGFRIPIGDVGKAVFDILQKNIELLAAHSHDGDNSYRIQKTNLAKQSVSLPSTDWDNSNPTDFFQDVQLPVNIQNIQEVDFEAYFQEGDDFIRFKPDVELKPNNIVRVNFSDNSKNVTLLY